MQEVEAKSLLVVFISNTHHRSQAMMRICLARLHMLLLASL